MTRAEEMYHEIAKELGVKEGKMFGSLCLKAPNGKALAIFKDDDMVFKLRGEAEAEAMEIEGAHLFDPMGNRPMGGWVQVPTIYCGKWKYFAEKSLEYVKTL